MKRGIVAVGAEAAQRAAACYPDWEVQEVEYAMPLHYADRLAEAQFDEFMFLGSEARCPKSAFVRLAFKQLERGYEWISPLAGYKDDPVGYFLPLAFVKRSPGTDRLIARWQNKLQSLNPWQAFREALFESPLRFWPAPTSWWQGKADGLVTAVVPCYRHEEFLPQAVKSALASGCIVLVVDDGSPDVPGALEEFRGRPVYVLQLKENRGLPKARNAGIRVARTQFIVSLDADDALEPGAVAAMRAAWKPGRWMHPDVQLFGDANRHVKVVVNESTMQSMQPAHPAILFAKDDWIAVGGYDETIAAFESWDFHARLMQAGVQPERVVEALVFYRKRRGRGMLSRILRDKQKYVAEVYDRNPAFFRARERRSRWPTRGV